MKIEEEKRQAIEAARIAQELAEEKERKRDKFLNDVKEVANARDYNQLKRLLESAHEHDIDPDPERVNPQRPRDMEPHLAAQLDGYIRSFIRAFFCISFV